MADGNEFRLPLRAEENPAAMAAAIMDFGHSPIAFAISAFFAIIDWKAGRALMRST